MAYRIVFLKGDAEIGSTPWRDDLASAKAHATNQFPIHRKQSDATSVIVIDVNRQKIVFSYPESSYARLT
ncbi:MAG TPA: hypothetical protein VIE65_05480 [Methylobacter sp.]